MCFANALEVGLISNMERKNYSFKKPVPRQTRWNQQQKRKRGLTVEEEQKSPSTSSSTSKQQDETTDNSMGDSNIVETSINQYEEVTDSQSLSHLPHIKPRRISDSEQLNESSDEDTCNYLDAVSSIIVYSESDSSEEETSEETDEESEKEADEETTDQKFDETEHVPMEQENECETSRIWSTQNQPRPESSQNQPESSNQEENSACPPPELKYPALVHILRTKHELSKEATEDVMEIVNDLSKLCLDKEVLPKDARTVHKIFEPFLSSAEKHYLCFQCGAYVGIKQQTNTYKCSNCKSRHAFKKSEYFFYMPLTDQLRQLFETNIQEVSVVFKDAEHSRESTHLIQSVRDGAKYKKYLQERDDNVLHITLSFSCDGVPVFSSSGSCLWPILCTINELPMNIRKRHIMVAALWYGTKKKKLDMNQFLYPFIRESRILYNRGFSFYRKGEEMICKCTFLKCVTDSVARPLMLQSHQFNGAYGCTGCLHPGEQVQKGKGSVRVYPHIDVARRTSDGTKQDAKEAIAKEEKPFHVNGIKGETILSYLDGFDIIDGLVPDYMHCSILGTTRQLAKLWFSSKYHDKPYYIGNAKENVNQTLSMFKPLFYVSRPVRDVDDMKFWKGHEWYWWAFVFSIPALKNILPNVYLKHWMLFTEALFILLQESIAKSQVYNAAELMVQFTQGTEQLYRLQNCSFNIHLGEHLSECVLNWGPLWENSAFIYEDFNQVVLKTIHSSKGVLEQVASQIRTMRSIPYVLATPAGDAISGMSVTKKERLLSTKSSLSCAHENCEVLVLSPNLKSITNEARLACVSYGITIQPQETLLFSHRVLLNGEVFHSKSNKLVKRRNSYTILLKNDKLFVVESCVVIKRLCFAVGRYLKIVKSFKLVGDKIALPYQICVSKDVEPLSVVDVSTFVCKVIFLDCYNLRVNIACIPPNRVEVLK